MRESRLRQSKPPGTPGSSSSATGGGRDRLTVFLLVMMLVVHNMQRSAVIPILGPLQDRLGTDYAGAGTLFAAYVLGYAMMQMVAGLLRRQVDPRTLLLIGLTASMALSLIFALVENYPLALLVRFLLGLTGAALYTPSISVAITGFERTKRGRVMGVMQSGAGLGSIAALVVVPVACSLLGITGGLMVLPVLCALMWILVALWFPLRAGSPLDPGSAPGPAAGPAATRSGFGRERAFWQLMAVSFLGMLATYGLLVWLPTYLTDTFGYSAISAGAFAAIPSVALVLAAPVAGRLADLPGGRLRVVMTGSLLALICYALLAVFHLAGLALVLSALIGASLAATTAPFMLLAGEHFSRAIVSRVVALMAAVAQGGATLAGVLFGVILSRGAGFDTIWIACAILAAARVLLLMSVSGRRAARTPAPG